MRSLMLTIEGNIVNKDKTFRGRVEIGDDGLISSVSKETGKADIVLNQELIFPGFVDLHVHAREDASHKEDYKEDFATAGEAAINGGVAAFAEMPNNPVPPIDGESYLQKQTLAKKSKADVILYAMITPNSNPLSFPVPYKAFTSKSVGDLFFNNYASLDEALKIYQGQSVSFHCEDPEILEKNQNQATHELRRPAEGEIAAIKSVLALIEKYQIKGKICHVSTKEGLQKIVDAKNKGINVVCEVTPHHLYFNEAMHLQVNPPLRGVEDCLALIEGLRAGSIDFLATDHAPHTIEERDKGISGLPHLDTFGPFTTWLMREHKFTPSNIARVCSFNPGQFINQFINIKYGKIEAGFTGCLTIVDPNKPITIHKSQLKTKCGWSPFEGLEFPGRVIYTIIKGKVYKNGA